MQPNLPIARSCIANGADVLALRSFQFTLSGKHIRQFPWMVDHDIRRRLCERVRCEAVSHSDGPQSGIASGFDIGVRVSHDGGLFGAHSALCEQLARALGIGFLRRKTVSAVDLREKCSQPQCLDDRPRRNDGLVGEHRQLSRRAVRRILDQL